MKKKVNYPVKPETIEGIVNIHESALKGEFAVSPSALKVLAVFCNFDQHHDREPTIQELLKMTGLSDRTIYNAEKELVKKGHLQIIEKIVVTGYRKQPIPEELRWEIFERDNFTCQHCGIRRFLTIDHIVPERLGGTLEKENLQTLCKSCNSKKGIKTV